MRQTQWRHTQWRATDTMDLQDAAQHNKFITEDNRDSFSKYPTPLASMLQ